MKILAIDQVAHGGGKLMMLFEDGASYETNFASFNVLRWFVRTWRKVYGTSLRINGTDAGLVGRDNP